MQLKHKKWPVQCMEKVLWLSERVNSGLRSFMVQISCHMMFHHWVDQLKLMRSNRDINWEQSTFYHAGDSWHTQNIQFNKVISENEKIFLLLYRRNVTDFLANPVRPPFVHTGHEEGKTEICEKGTVNGIKGPAWLWTAAREEGGK